MQVQLNNRPLALVTNDDGIHSPFLRALADALAVDFEVAVAAPLREKSWIGRAMTRHGSISVQAVDGFPGSAWAIDGTPTDCVNIALGHLLGKMPQIVLSGINIGYNTTIPLVYSSGTVAGALEGAHWGLPAVAVSQALDREHFIVASNGDGQSEMLKEMLAHTARQTTSFALGLLQREDVASPAEMIVHNLNFPFPSVPGLKWEKTVPARSGPGSFFQQNKASGSFQFIYQRSKCVESAGLTDREVVESGRISWSILNFAELGKV